MKVLVVGVGNVLRGDDGFGVAVADRLLSEPLPPAVRVLELGIGGIHLVQELFEPVDGLVVVDAVETGRPPGTVVVIRPEVEDVRSMSLVDRHDRLADMHYATPDRAFMLARAMDLLPERVWVVGCQPVDAATPGEGLSGPVERAVDEAVAQVRRLVSELGVRWETVESGGRG